MIKYNDKIVTIDHFPDGTLLMKEQVEDKDNSTKSATLTWFYENNEELVALFFITKHLNAKGVQDITLKLPYIPNARQDRVKKEEDIFTLKYFAEMINGLHFTKVIALDPHSHVSEALIDRIEVQTPQKYVERVLEQLKQNGKNDVVLFFPDEGAMKRYASMFNCPYVFGIKKRDWVTGKILGLEVAGQTECVPGRTVLIVDDISSKGGTFYYSAKALKELGANDIYLYISHCENTILQGEVLSSDYVTKVFTTNSIFTEQHEKVEVFDYE